MEKLNLFEKLSLIQNEMNCPKNLWNKFGSYWYRNAETIIDSAKEICSKYRTTLVLVDDIVIMNNRYYVKAIATLYDWDSDMKIDGVAYAREEEAKKGMDASQITGSASSYARKYALNGLFNLDDVKDADSNEQQEENENKQKPKLISKKQMELIGKYYKDENLQKLLDMNNISKLEDLPMDVASRILERLFGKGESKNENNQ